MDNRIAKWDNCKALLMLLVIIGHTTQHLMANSFYYSITAFIYSFHMPAFVFISGLFSKNAIKNKDINKVAPYLVIYLITQVISFFVEGVSKGDYKIALTTPANLPWFMLSLFIMYLFTMMIQDYNKMLMLTVALLLSVFIGYESFNMNLFAIGKTVVFYPFFYLGFIIDPQKLEKKLNSLPIRLISAVTLCAFFVFCLLKIDLIRQLFPLTLARTSYETLGKYYHIGGLLRLVLSLVSLIMTIMFISLVPEKKSVITSIGQRTISIYATHNFFVYIIYVILEFKSSLLELRIRQSLPIVITISVILLLLCSNRLFYNAIQKLFSLFPRKASNQVM